MAPNIYKQFASVLFGFSRYQTNLNAAFRFMPRGKVLIFVSKFTLKYIKALNILVPYESKHRETNN